MRNFSGNASVVFFNLEIPKEFLKVKLRMITSEECLSKEDCAEIDKYIFSGLTRNWYSYNNITEYRGIHLGSILEYDFQRYLTPRVKNLEIIKKIADGEKIKKIVAIDDTAELGPVARLYAGMLNIPVLEISFLQKKNKLGAKVKSKLASQFSRFLDALAFQRLMRDKNEGAIALVDTRISKMLLKFQDTGLSFMLCPFEKGVGLRLDLIKQGFSYLPLYFEKGTRSNRRDTDNKKWQALSLDENFKRIFQYKDISVWEIIKDKLSVFFLEYLPRIISNIDLLERLLKTKRIKIAVLRNDVKEFERTVILALRMAKIPSLAIQHGILAETNGHNILLADRFAAWGSASVDWYKRYGNPGEKFEVTGNPKFDTFINWRPEITKEELCRKLNLDADKGIILFATQQINKFSSFWTDDLFWVMTDRLLGAIAEFPDKQLVIKVDPYEYTTPYRERILASSYNHAVAIRDIDIYTLIYFCDLVITQDSTVALEAMVLDKPVITFNLTKRENRVPYVEKKAALGVSKSEDLLPVIKKALTDTETISGLKRGRMEFIKEYAYKIDGRSKERLLNILKDYVNPIRNTKAINNEENKISHGVKN